MNDITKISTQLQSVGLNDKQATVYVTLLFLGPSRVKTVAEQTGLKRPTCYLILEELIEMGLASQSQQGDAKIVVAEPPEAITRLLDKQIEDQQNRKKDFINIAKLLARVQNTSTQNAPKIRFYKGKEGELASTRYVQSHSKKGSTIYSFSNMDEVLRLRPTKPQENVPYRVKNNISSHIFYSSDKDNDLTTDRKLLREAKKLKEPIAADINLQEDFAVITTYEDKELLQIVIESKPIVKALRQLYSIAWDNYKK